VRRLFKNKPFIIMLAAIVLLGALALATSGDRAVSWAESAVGSVVQPVQTFASKASYAIRTFFQRIFKTTDADIENERMQRELVQMQSIREENEKLRKQNERLSEMLNYITNFQNNTFVTADVIGGGQGMWFDVFTINAGRNRGIAKGMAVISSKGLVGKITDVGAAWSKVTAIIDPSMSVYAMVDRTRDAGMVQGTLSVDSQNMLELYFLPMGSDLVPGDLIMSNSIAGFEDIFPKGILIGTVKEVFRRGDDSKSCNATILPATDFNHLEEVMVITGLKDMGED